MDLSAVPIDKPDGLNVIVGQAHFVKVVEDIHEALVGASPHLLFGLAFCEASGQCLVRRSGNNKELVEHGAVHAEAIGAGHSFVILLRDGYPINVLNALRPIPEICSLFCGTANAVEVLIAQTDLGRAIIGVVDGMPPAGIDQTRTRPPAKAISERSATSSELADGRSC